MSTDGNALWRIKTWFPDLDDSIANALKAYHAELLKYNLKLNLISRPTERDADEQHFADCISAVKVVLPKLEDAKEIFDLGSGNGLPGIVLGIFAKSALPGLKVVLVDSDERKCEFLKHLAHSLELTNTQVLNSRIEDIKTPMQFAINRGFASVSKTCLACKAITAVGGQVFHMKGSNWFREVGEMPSQLTAFWAPELVGDYSLPASQAKRAVLGTRKLK